MEEKGATDIVIKEFLKDISSENLVDILNNLLESGKISIYKSKNIFYYKANAQSLTNNNLSENDERIVFQAIKESGNKGIWIRDIRNKSNLAVAHLNKILKNLETRKMIKTVSGVAASKKKVFMLYDVEPDPSITGGAWFSDQEFESEFVQILSDQCLKYINNSIHSRKIKLTLDDLISEPLYQYVSSQEILIHITKSKISKVPLTILDMEMILDKLIYDNLLVSINIGVSTLSPKIKYALNISSESTDPWLKFYKIKEMLYKFNLNKKDTNSTEANLSLPCISCANLDSKCNIHHDIKPHDCLYLNDWLKLWWIQG